MKNYNVTCPHCGEPSVCAYLNNPMEVYCRDCEEDINVKKTITSVIGWIRYAMDLNQNLPAKSKINIPKEVSEVANGTRQIDLP